MDALSPELIRQQEHAAMDGVLELYRQRCRDIGNDAEGKSASLLKSDTERLNAVLAEEKTFLEEALEQLKQQLHEISQRYFRRIEEFVRQQETENLQQLEQKLMQQ